MSNLRPTSRLIDRLSKFEDNPTPLEKYDDTTICKWDSLRIEKSEPGIFIVTFIWKGEEMMTFRFYEVIDFDKGDTLTIEKLNGYSVIQEV